MSRPHNKGHIQRPTSCPIHPSELCPFAWRPRASFTDACPYHPGVPDEFTFEIYMISAFGVNRLSGRSWRGPTLRTLTGCAPDHMRPQATGYRLQVSGIGIKTGIRERKRGAFLFPPWQRDPTPERSFSTCSAAASAGCRPFPDPACHGSRPSHPRLRAS